MKPLLLFLLATIILSCTSETKPLLDKGLVAKAKLDSSRISDLVVKLNRGYYENIPDFSKIDTVYLFEMHGSWGGLYSCSAVFPDSAGYSAISNHQLGGDFEKDHFTYSITHHVISQYQWLDLDKKTTQSGFWNFRDSFMRGCVDGQYYTLWIKQGQKTKILYWTNCDKVPDSTRILATQILSICGRPQAKTIAWYTDRNDSILIKVNFYADTFFVKSQQIELNGNEIDFTHSNIVLRTPKIKTPFSFLPASIFLKKNWMDGTVEKELVTDFRKVSKENFHWK